MKKKLKTLFILSLILNTYLLLDKIVLTLNINTIEINILLCGTSHTNQSNIEIENRTFSLLNNQGIIYNNINYIFKVVNNGIGGSDIRDFYNNLYYRQNKDLEYYDYVTIEYVISALKVDIESFKLLLENIIISVINNHSIPILVTSIFISENHKGYSVNERLKPYNDIVYDLSKKYSIKIIDILERFKYETEKNNTLLYESITNTHPNENGSKIIYEEYYKTLVEILI